MSNVNRKQKGSLLVELVIVLGLFGYGLIITTWFGILCVEKFTTVYENYKQGRSALIHELAEAASYQTGDNRVE